MLRSFQSVSEHKFYSLTVYCCLLKFRAILNPLQSLEGHCRSQDYHQIQAESKSDSFQPIQADQKLARELNKWYVQSEILDLKAPKRLTMRKCQLETAG